MNTSIDELHKMLIKAASKIVSEDEAAYFSSELIETHIRKSNVTNPLESAIKDLEKCLENIQNKIERRVELPAYVCIDFHSQGPLPYIKQIHDNLEERSSKYGIAMTSFVNSQGMHTLHNWVQGLAKRGLVALAACNGGPAAVIPFNGTKGVFGTNPIAYGFPGKSGDIHCIDMATSEVPYFEIIKAKSEGRLMAEGVAVDNEGNQTIDPSKALDYSLSKTDPISNLLPLGGGYKGYYLNYLLEMLTGGLVGAKSSAEMSADFVAEEHGSFLIVFNPRAMGTQDALQNSVFETHSKLAQQTPKSGNKIQIPGEGNNSRYVENKRKSIQIDAALMARLKILGEELL